MKIIKNNRRILKDNSVYRCLSFGMANLTDEEKQAVYELPNFDKDIFEQITETYIENPKSKKGNSKMRKIFGIVAKMFKIRCHHCGDVVEWQKYNTAIHRHIYKCRNCGKEWIW